MHFLLECSKAVAVLLGADIVACEETDGFTAHCPVAAGCLGLAFNVGVELKVRGTRLCPSI